MESADAFQLGHACASQASPCTTMRARRSCCAQRSQPQSRPQSPPAVAMAQPGQQHRWWDGRWDGWYQRPSGLWQHRGYEWRGDGWSRGGAPWYPREAVYDAKAKREDVEWKATLDEWLRAAGDENGSDDDRFGLFDHALPSQNEVIADAEEEGDRGTGFTHVSLVGAPAGERYCFPGVGQPPDFLQRQGSCKGDPLAQNKRCHCWCETSPEGAARRCGHKPRHRHKCSKCRTLVCTGSCWIAHRQMCHLCSTHSSGDQCDPEQ